MSYKILSIAALAAATMSPAAAQDLQGASVSGIFVSLEDDTATSFEGGADFAVSGGFALGANVGLYNGGAQDDTGFNGTLHGMYMTSPNSAFGLFVARDSQDGGDSDSIGLEYGFGSESGRFEVYYGALENGTDLDSYLGGISFEFAVAEGFSLSFDYDVVTLADDAVGVGVGTGAFGARYQFASGPSVYLEVGSVAVAASDGVTTVSETVDEFIGIGAEMSFGRSSGALFSNRTVFDTVGF